MADITKTCAVSGENFVITDDDQKFYKRIEVPLPTLSPLERERRRMAYRNERSFYQRTCDLCKKQIISIFNPDTIKNVYCNDCWWSDRWDPLTYGRDFDFNKSFFEQFDTFYHEIPKLAIALGLSENSDYSNFCYRVKNCYMLIASDDCEDCYYGNYMFFSKNSADCHNVIQCELCYELINSRNCYNSKYSQLLEDCTDCAFCFDLKGCSYCFGSCGLRNKSFVLFNKQLTKEEYLHEVGSYKFTHDSIHNFKNKLHRLELEIPHKYAQVSSCENCVGDNLNNSKNAFYCFDSFGLEDCKYITNGPGKLKDCYDLTGAKEAELCLEGISIGGPGYFNRCNLAAFNGAKHTAYSNFCTGTDSCFGSIGLRHSQYCILNKEYSKEEYMKLLNTIIAHMQSTNEWGEYFPIHISPFAYNETLAQEFYPLTKSEAEKRGFTWKTENNKENKKQTYKTPEEITDVKDDILSTVLACEETGRNFKVIEQELDLYRKLNVPVPRLHPDVRHAHRLSMLNPHRIWERTCGNCGKRIHSSYDPARPETVYCEECYIKAIN